MNGDRDIKKETVSKQSPFTCLLNYYGCHFEYPNPIIIMLTTSMPLPRVMALSLVARQVIKDPMPIMIVPSIADSL